MVSSDSTHSYSDLREDHDNKWNIFLLYLRKNKGTKRVPLLSGDSDIRTENGTK